MFNDPGKAQVDTVSLDETMIAPQMASIHKEIIVEVPTSHQEPLVPPK